jgi:hypothetical protein
VSTPSRVHRPKDNKGNSKEARTFNVKIHEFIVVNQKFICGLKNINLAFIFKAVRLESGRRRAWISSPFM